MTTLNLEFSADEDGNSFLNSQYASYPFHICRTQYFEKDPQGMANIYIQSASGGIYQNESLTTNVVTHQHASCHITTQASTIVHSMPNGSSAQTINIEAKNHAYTEYISDPLILFPESELHTNINLTIDDNSTVIIIDGFITHNFGSSSTNFRQYNSNLSIYSSDNKLLMRDIYSVTPDILNPFSDVNFNGMGTITLITNKYPLDTLLNELQTELQSNSNIYGGASKMPNNTGLMIKFLFPKSNLFKETSIYYWKVIRQHLFGIMPITRKK